jgi:hypothetical protein
MRRGSILIGLAILGAVFLIVGGALLLAITREPEFYRAAALPPGRERQKNSQEFMTRSSDLYDGIKYRKVWLERFTEAQINSFFDEDFVKSGFSTTMLPEHIEAPRVSITQDKIRLAFRYGLNSWCGTVVSIDFRVNLATAEPNCIALELQGLHAGSLPISTQSLLERVSEVARRQNIEVSWYRNSDGNAVALLRFQANQARPTVLLDRLELNAGEIVIGGRSLEAVQPLRAMIGDDTLTPPVGN